MEAAKKDGVSDAIIQFGQEMASFKAELYKQAMKSADKSVEFAELSLDSYPNLKIFFGRFQERAKELRSKNQPPEKPEIDPKTKNPEASSRQSNFSGIKLPQVMSYFVSLIAGLPAYAQQVYQSTIYECGYYWNPTPNYKPQNIFYSSSNPPQALINYGFHLTVGYACGNWISAGYPCNIDYTRDRSYSGANGFCTTPLFRDQGQIDQTKKNSYWIQFAEPNPEVYRSDIIKLYPEWDWDAYVFWWHQSF